MIAAGVFLGLGALTQDLAHGQANAPAAPEKKAEPAAPTFSPEVEKKLKEYYGKVREAALKVRIERMEMKIGEIAESTGLKEPGKLALKESARKASEISADKLVSLMDGMMRKNYRQLGDQLEEMIDQMLGDPEQVALSGFYPGETPTDEEPVWTEALRKVLAPEQWEGFAKQEAERTAKLRKEIDGVVKASVEVIQKQQEEYLLTRSGEVKQGLDLPEDRRKKLDEGAESVAKTVAADWTEKLEKMLLTMPEQNRRQIVKQGRYYVGMDDDAVKKVNELWDKHVQEVLTPEEASKVATTKAEDRAARAKALGLVLISMLDEHVAFTKGQREQLIPIAEKLVAQEETMFPPATTQYYNINTISFFTAANKAADDVLAPILTKQQLARWRDAATKKQRRTSNIQINRGLAAQKKDEPLPLVAPEEVEEIITDFLLEKEVDQRELLLSDATLRADDAAHIVKLTPEALARLEVAAQGVAEIALTNWRANIERNIRSQLSNLNPQQIRQRLAGMESYQYYTGPISNPVPIWDNTVKEVLSPEQNATWTEEIEHRQAFRQKAAAASILAEFDRRFSATAEQSQKLEAFLAKFLEDYSPDIERMFSSGNSAPWYLATYSVFLPFGSLDEKKAMEYMTKEQWDQLKASNEFSNATNYWENVEQQHKQRVKQKDESKKPS